MNNGNKHSDGRMVRIFIIVLANNLLARFLLAPMLIGAGCCIAACFGALAEGSFVLPLMVGGGLGLLGYLGLCVRQSFVVLQNFRRPGAYLYGLVWGGYLSKY